MKLQRHFFFLFLSLSIHFILFASFYWPGSGDSQNATSVQIAVLTISEVKGEAEKASSQREKDRSHQETHSPRKKEPSGHSEEKSTSQARALTPSRGPLQFQLEVNYPSLSLKAREEGEAMFRLYFSQDQKLSDFELVESSGYDRLDKAVRKALQAQQVPGKVHLEQVLTVRFRLAEAMPTVDLD